MFNDILFMFIVKLTPSRYFLSSNLTPLKNVDMLDIHSESGLGIRRETLPVKRELKFI
jgi:hypothetical protein